MRKPLLFKRVRYSKKLAKRFTVSLKVVWINMSEWFVIWFYHNMFFLSFFWFILSFLFWLFFAQSQKWRLGELTASFTLVFLSCLEKKLVDISGALRERQWLHQLLSLAVIRGNIASILACVQVWSHFSHLQCINQCSCPSLASLQWIAVQAVFVKFQFFKQIL